MKRCLPNLMVVILTLSLGLFSSGGCNCETNPHPFGIHHHS